MLLHTQELCKQYRRGDVAVDALIDVTLDVPDGTFATVTGPSGSGKTTLLLTLAGLLTPTSGNIQFKGTELTSLSDAKPGLFSNCRKMPSRGKSPTPTRAPVAAFTWTSI